MNNIYLLGAIFEGYCTVFSILYILNDPIKVMQVNLVG